MNRHREASREGEWRGRGVEGRAGEGEGMWRGRLLDAKKSLILIKAAYLGKASELSPPSWPFFSPALLLLSDRFHPRSRGATSFRRMSIAETRRMRRRSGNSRWTLRSISRKLSHLCRNYRMRILFL